MGIDPRQNQPSVQRPVCIEVSVTEDLPSQDNNLFDILDQATFQRGSRSKMTDRLKSVLTHLNPIASARDKL